MIYIRFLLCAALMAIGSVETKAQTEEVKMSAPNAHQFVFNDVEGNTLKLAAYAGQVVLVVNTASHCGLTPQYAGLQKLYEQYKKDGLVVLGVPSADFGGQEFDNEAEVEAFTEENFAITFPLTTIEHVKGGKAHPFYKWAKSKTGFLGGPKWNFHKYLIGRDGEFVASFGSMTKPTSEKITKVIENALKVPQK